MHQPSLLPDDDLPTARELQDSLLVTALAQGSTYVEAGEVARVSARTVRRRMADLNFKRRVRTARAERVDVVTGQLTGAAAKALTVMVDALESRSDAVRVNAARLVLSFMQRFHSQSDLEARLEALEALLDDADDSPETAGR